MYCNYAQDDTESSGVRGNGCTEFSMKSVHFAQTITFFESTL